MATVAHQYPTSTPAQARAAPRSMDTSRSPSASTSASMAPAQPAPPLAKKAKAKKSADPSEQQKQIQAKIAQLEQDAAGDKEQELEIGALPLHTPRLARVGLCTSHPMHKLSNAKVHGLLKILTKLQSEKSKRPTESYHRSSTAWTAH